MLAAAEKHSAWISGAIVVSVSTGIRQSDLLSLEWAHVDFAKKSLLIQNSKISEPHRVYLNDPLITALKKLRRDGIVGCKHVFVNDEGEAASNFYLIWRWRKVHKAAGLVNFRWHDLRHYVRIDPRASRCIVACDRFPARPQVAPNNEPIRALGCR